MDYSPAPQISPGSNAQHILGPFRSGASPIALRSNGVVCVDNGVGYGYGNVSSQPTTAGDVAYTFPGAVPCYPEPTAGGEERGLPLSSSRARPGSVNTLGRRATAISNGADHAAHAALVDIGSNGYNGYDGSTLSSYHAASMDRGLYTTVPQVDDFGQGNSLRTTLPGYSYRYTDSTSDRGPENGNSTALDDHHYLAHGRAVYFASASSTDNDHLDGRATSSAAAGLHG
jgi:hypothetical protein